MEMQNYRTVMGRWPVRGSELRGTDLSSGHEEFSEMSCLGKRLRAKGVVKIHGTSHVSWEIFGWLGESEDACIQLVYLHGLHGCLSLQAGFAVTKVAVTSQNGLE